jgi:carbamate kinase
MRIVIALGGNALLRRGEPMDAELQRGNVVRAVKALAPIAQDHQVIVTHGNGPQVGLLALQAASYRAVKPYPFDVLNAESEGMIGYLIEQAFANELPGREVATLLTQVEVDLADPAFSKPTKPIGPIYNRTEAADIVAKTGWSVVADAGGVRRAIASPIPQRIREINVIKLLADAGVLVICAGGGGIPVAATADGWRGVEAVIDKDLSAALLAEAAAADMLVLLTDVSAVWTHWPMSVGIPITSATCRELRALEFDAGSMGPKVESACRFVERTGRTAAIGAVEQAEAILRGEAGTRISAA